MIARFAATLAALGTLPLTLPAQTPADVIDGARGFVTVAALERHARAIVQHERPSGSAGENAAIDYIVATLRADGIHVEVHTFLGYTSNPVSASVRDLSDGYAPPAITMAFSGATTGLTGPLVDLGTLGDLPELEVGTGERLALPAVDTPWPDLGGAVALVTGQPRNEPTLAIAAMGAAGVIYVNPDERVNDLIVTSTWGTPSLRNAHRLPTIPVAHVARSAGEELRRRLADGPVTVELAAEVDAGWTPLRLAVARVRPEIADAPYVLLGGHIDAWYHGGTDEGASNAAMVELARAFHANRAALRRGLVVAWWPGHSNARYGGSTWFADQFFTELRDRAVAYVNIDGVGQTGAKRFGASTTSALAPLAGTVVARATGADISPVRPGRNSDQSFNGIGLPLLQINHTRLAEDGGYWWWHTPDDTFDKIDFDVLKLDTDLYVEALGALLTEPVLPVDLVQEAMDLGAAIDRRQVEAGDAFDLGAASAAQQRFLDAARAVMGQLERTHGPADLALVRILRPIYRVLFLPFGPYHPDPGRGLGLLPGLAAAAILGETDPGSDRYRFAETTLQRELNRLVDAIDAATREARRFSASPPGADDSR